MLNFKYISENWSKYDYPWIPKWDALQFFESEIKKSKKVCILGSTKSFRYFCKKYDIEVDIYDLSIDMIRKNEVENEKESVYVQNWLDIRDKKYDLIIGDLILFLLDEESQSKLLANLCDNLNPGGKILLRTGGSLEHIDERGFSFMLTECEINLENINMICYELSVGMMLKTQGISEYIQEKNKELGDFFQKEYSHITPYGNTHINIDTVSQNGKTIFRKDFFLSYESIIEFNV